MRSRAIPLRASRVTRASRVRARRPAPAVLFAALLVGLALAVAGACCRSDTYENVQPTAETELVVFAAASLRDAFTALGERFERSWPGVEVTFSFAGTQELRTQLEQGAAVDVLASADRRHMEALVGSGRVVAPVVFARNEPVVIVAKEAAATIRTFSDLPAARRIVLGTAEVPIGRYTLQILDRASTILGADFRSRVEARVVSRELSTRQVLTKVRLGEAQAGVVYRSDAPAAGDDVTIVTIPPAINVTAEYPIAVVAGAAHPRLARAWVDLVLSPEGQEVLRRAGLQPVGTPRFDDHGSVNVSAGAGAAP